MNSKDYGNAGRIYRRPQCPWILDAKLIVDNRSNKKKMQLDDTCTDSIYME